MPKFNIVLFAFIGIIFRRAMSQLRDILGRPDAYVLASHANAGLFIVKRHQA